MEPDSAYIYLVVVSFNAPASVRTDHQAVLTLSYDNIAVDISLQAQTGNVIIEPCTEVPSVFLGDETFYNHSVTNNSNVPVVINTSGQSRVLGINLADHDFEIAANTKSVIKMVVQTSGLYYHKGNTSFTAELKARYGMNGSVRSVTDSMFCHIKDPTFIFPSNGVKAFQGQDCAFNIDIFNHGPASTFSFTANNLPEGVTMNPFKVPAYALQNTTKVVHLKIDAHAQITPSGGIDPIVSISCSAYNGEFKTTFNIPLKVLNVFKIQPQQNTNWCWAATTASCFKFYGGLVSQCTVVEKIKPNPGIDPCIIPTPEEANVGAYTPIALNYFGVLKEVKSGALSQSEVIAEIDMGNPVALRIKWFNSNGLNHAIVISGYVTSADGSVLLIVNDPGNGSSVSLLDIVTLTKMYNDAGFWERTYLTRAPGPPIQVDTTNDAKTN